MARDLEADLVREMLKAAQSSDEDSLSVSTSESSDSDDFLLDAIQELRRNPRNCIPNFCENVVPQYNDKEFVTHFRLSRTLWLSLATRFENSEIYLQLIAKENSRSCISPQKHILVFLWFAGHQTSSFRDVADRFDISISSLHYVITRVINFLSELSSEYIKWPTDEEKLATEQHYIQTKGVPHVIGHIDGTHVQIDRPAQSHDDYINRKGVHTIIMQGVCNEKKKFIDVFIGFPGSVHDARVFRNSPLFEDLEHNCEGSYIFGDSAYPCLKTLLTPYRDNGHLTRVQKYFNQKLSSCRVDIEHSFGILKQRFRQLYHLKLKGHARICHFIRACCVLHNVANMEDINIFDEEENPPDPTPDIEEKDQIGAQDAGVTGPGIRDEIARQLFMHNH